MSDTAISPGKFLVLEGVDCTGKTTQGRLLAEALNARGIKATYTREFDATALGRTLSAVLQATETTQEAISPLSELLLFYASRNHHLEQVVRPALEAGEWVICDRFVESSFVYQIVAGNLDPELFYYLTGMVVRETIPSLTITFDATPELVQERLKQRGTGLDRLEEYYSQQLPRLIEIYRTLAQNSPNHLLVDSSLPVAEQQAQILAHLFPAQEKEG